MMPVPDEEAAVSGLGDGDQHGARDTHDGANDDHQHGAQVGRPSGRYQRVELITGEPRRRRWSGEEKSRITALSFEPGCNISALARDHGVSVGLLHYWRRMARERMTEGEMKFVPLLAVEAPAGDGAASDGAITLKLHGVCIQITGRVDRVALETVLAAVRAGA